MKKFNIKGIFFRIFVLIMAVVLVFVVTKSNFDFGDDVKYIYSTFIGQKSPYNGIIEVWNIDSFESGLKSKASYLEKIAKKFQKKNKGVYVMVRNLSIGECENLLNSGEIPDIISCSYGISDRIKDYVFAFESEISTVPSNFLEAGMGKDGKLYWVSLEGMEK